MLTVAAFSAMFLGYSTYTNFRILPWPAKLLSTYRVASNSRHTIQPQGPCVPHVCTRQPPPRQTSARLASSTCHAYYTTPMPQTSYAQIASHYPKCFNHEVHKRGCTHVAARAPATHAVLRRLCLISFTALPGGNTHIQDAIHTPSSSPLGIPMKRYTPRGENYTTPAVRCPADAALSGVSTIMPLPVGAGRSDRPLARMLYHWAPGACHGPR